MVVVTGRPVNVGTVPAVLRKTAHPGNQEGRTVALRRDSRPQAESTDLDLSCDPGLRLAWRSHADELYGYARKALGDAAAAEEALQETFLRAWRAADRYDASRPLRPWLFAILRNVVIDEARARGVRPVPRDREPAESVEPLDDPLERALDAWLVEEALRRIRPEHRVVLVETYYRARPYAEVAVELGIPEGTARSRAFYGLRALRLALEEMGWEG
jgi:RNA polymerase sigma-70 factor (ECF subfamily)